MPNNRLPTHKRAAAAAAGNGARYRNIPDAPTSDTIGPVSDWLDPLAAAEWSWCVREWWWLTEADRPVLELIVILKSRLKMEMLKSSEITQYVVLLSKIGATPADRGKIELPGNGDGGSKMDRFMK